MGKGPANSDAFGLDYAQPAADLRPYISSYYLFRADLPHMADVVRADMAQLRFILRGRGQYHFSGGGHADSPGAALIGPTTGATRFEVTGPLLVFGIGIHPAGWAAIVQEDASLLADRIVDATALLGPCPTDELWALAELGQIDAMCEVADRMMRCLLAAGRAAPLAFTRLTDAWLTGEVSPSLDDLIRDVGLSSRQVERLARRIYGAPPKLLARKYRALRLASIIGAEPIAWTEAIGDAFYDQSHFIRDFKHFTGLTPRRFQQAPTPVTRLTLQRRALGEQLPMIARLS